LENRLVIQDIFLKPKPIIGMVHLRPLPGSPLYDAKNMGIKEIIDLAVREACILEAAGVDGIQVENIWDFPYVKNSQIGLETVASMAVVASKVKDAVSIPMGINVHLNGGFQALAIACSVGARWIRVFEWVNAYVSHVGITEGIGGELARYRARLQAKDVRFFCDVNVKHGSHFIISDRSVSQQAHDAESSGAEVLIVTGFETGMAPTAAKVRELRESVRVPILVGSGTTAENIEELLTYADGAIVGSYFKKDNDWKNPVDACQAKRFMESVNTFRRGIEND
jgi:uncharacterized protein